MKHLNIEYLEPEEKQEKNIHLYNLYTIKNIEKFNNSSSDFDKIEILKNFFVWNL